MGEAARALRSFLKADCPGLAIVLGSGSSSFLHSLDHSRSVSFNDIPGLPSSGVSGHPGEFVIGSLEGVTMLIQAGRLHLYEGHAPGLVSLPVAAMVAAGVGNIILTNAAGSLDPALGPGDLMLITSTLNLTFKTHSHVSASQRPGRAAAIRPTPDGALTEALAEAARNVGLRLVPGTYAGLTGPPYETAAEIRMLRAFGANAVGMSTVLEAAAISGLGGRFAAISMITNRGTGLTTQPLTHDEVLAVGAAAVSRLETLIRAFIRSNSQNSPVHSATLS